MGAAFRQLAFDSKTKLAQRSNRAAAKQMEVIEKLDPDELRRLQMNDAMKIVRYAFHKSPFYRDFYSDAGFCRSDLEDPAAFSSLPILSKEHLRRFKDRITVSDIPPSRVLTASTGGSTGEPLTLHHDRLAPTAAMWWTVYRWWGLHPSVDTAFILRERRTSTQLLSERLQWWPTERVLLDSRNMTTASMAEFAETVQKLKPSLLTGYIGGVYEFADFLDTRKITLPPLTAVGVTAAPLPQPQRRFMESVLHSPVYDQYRTAEVPWIAAECRERSGLHVLAGARLLELVDTNGNPAAPDTVGEVLITDLRNRVFPVIRYQNGDLTALRSGSCPCEMTLPVIDPVQGRISDVIRLPNGQSIAGGMNAIFNAHPDAVQQFQVHQQSDYSITLRCVPGPGKDSSSAIKQVLEQLTETVANTVPVRLELVDAIQHDRGKARIIRSDAPLSPAGGAV